MGNFAFAGSLMDPFDVLRFTLAYVALVVIPVYGSA